MIKNRRLWGVCTVLGGAALLGGCVAVPGGSYAAIPSPTTRIRDRSWSSRTCTSTAAMAAAITAARATPIRTTGGAPATTRIRAIRAPAGAGARVLPSPCRRHTPVRGSGGGAGVTVPVPPGRSPREINRMLNSPDSRNQTPP